MEYIKKVNQKTEPIVIAVMYITTIFLKSFILILNQKNFEN